MSIASGDLGDRLRTIMLPRTFVGKGATLIAGKVGSNGR